MATQEDARDYLRRVPFLADLGDQHMTALVGAMPMRRLEKGKALFRRGDPGESMVIVGSGRLSVRVRHGDGETEVAAVYPGEVVGEMACIDPAPRSASVVASKDTVLFECQRRTLDAIRQHAAGVHVAIVGGVINHLTRRIRDTNGRIEREMDARGLSPTSRSDEGTSFPTDGSNPAKTEDAGRIDLRALKCFSEFSNEELTALLKVAPARKYPDGSVLCREGDVGASCYIVATGAVNVVRHMSGSDRVLATLEKGTLVGQMALVDRAPRSATIRAFGETVVLELHRKAFQQLLAAASAFALRFQHQIAVAGIRQLRTADERLETALQTEAPAPRPKAPPRPDASQLKPPGGLARGLPPVAGRGGRQPARPSETTRPERSSPALSGLGAKLKTAFSKIPTGASVGGGGESTPKGCRPTEDEQEEMMLAYMQAALGEWDMDMSDLDSVQAVRPGGTMTAAEKKSRGV